MMTATATYLSWDLQSRVEYRAGQELQFTLRFTAPPGTYPYYVIGALYTRELVYIPESLFGIFMPPEADFAQNSGQYTSIWELAGEESVEIPCHLVLARSDCVLVLFLMRLKGEQPNLQIDEEIASVQAELNSPFVLTVESATQLAMAAVMIGYMGHLALKEL